MKVRRLVGAVALAVVANSCGGAAPAPSLTTPTAPTTPSVSSVVVSGWTLPLNVGDQVALSATALFTDGTSRSVSEDASWESSNAAVATVSKGLVRAVGEGAAAIIARYGGKDGNQGITVQKAPATSPTPTPPPSAGLACGVERWFVKTLSDSAATSVNVASVRSLSIQDLNGFATHCSGLPDNRAYSEEFSVFEVVGRVTYIAYEDDRDYHIALEDPNNPAFSVVAELADTLCAGAVGSPHLSLLRNAEAMWAALLGSRSPSSLVGTTVRVRGVGFYDFAHGQRGRSQNCIELHPILTVDHQ